MFVAPEICDMRLSSDAGSPAVQCIEVDNRPYPAREWQVFARICISRLTYLPGGRVIVFQKLITQPQPQVAALKIIGRQGSSLPPRQKSYDVDLEEYLAD